MEQILGMKRLVLGGCIGVGFILFRPVKLPVAEGPPYQPLPKLPYAQHPNQHFLSKVPTTVGIIGAGISGLITAKVLAQQGYTVQVLEKRDHIGGVWYDNYEGAGLQAPYFIYNIPDFPFPADTPMIPKQDVILRHIEKYTDKFALRERLRLNTEVRAILQLDDSTWEVTLNDGSKLRYDFLVVCNGTYNLPYTPSFPNQSVFQGKILHSSEFKHAESICSGKKVVVIGAGKSAQDIQDVASEHASSVTGLVRANHWTIPLSFTILGLHPGYTMTSKFFALFQRPEYSESGWINALLRPIGWMYWRYVGWKLVRDLPVSAHPDCQFIDEFPHIDTRTTQYTEKLKTGKILIKRGSIANFTPNGIQTTTGEPLEADIVVLATGFKQCFFGTEEDDGEQWRYRHMLLPGVKNYAVLGHVATVRTSLIVSLQAVWLAEVLRGQVKLPSNEDMKADIEARKRYMKEHGTGGIRSLHARADFIAKELLEDMKLQVVRTKNLFTYYFGSSSAEDYQSVITHRV